MSIGTGVWYNGDYTMVVSCCDGKYMYRVCPKVPSKKWFEGKMVLSCPPQLSWEGKRGEHLGHIYLHDGDVE